MEEIVKKERVVVDNIHRFTCDKCGKFLGEVTECSDGYYREIGRYSESISLNYIRRKCEMKAILCDKCRDELEKDVETYLKDLGYESFLI